MPQQLGLFFGGQFAHIFHDSTLPFFGFHAGFFQQCPYLGFQIKWRQTFVIKNHMGFSTSHHKRDSALSLL